MKKITKIFAIAAIMLASSTVTASAQSLIKGITAGTNVSTAQDFQSKWGYQAGAVVGLDLPLVNITAEVLYVQNEFEGSIVLADKCDASIVSRSIEIPLLASLTIFGPLHIKFGPSFTLYNDAKADIEGYDTYSIGQVKPSVGYVVGIGLGFLKKIYVDARFNGVVSSKITDNLEIPYIDTDATTFDIKSNTISLNATYRF